MGVMAKQEEENCFVENFCENRYFRIYNIVAAGHGLKTTSPTHALRRQQLTNYSESDVERNIAQFCFRVHWICRSITVRH